MCFKKIDKCVCVCVCVPGSRGPGVSAVGGPPDYSEVPLDVSAADSLTLSPHHGVWVHPQCVCDVFAGTVLCVLMWIMMFYNVSMCTFTSTHLAGTLSG